MRETDVFGLGAISIHFSWAGDRAQGADRVRKRSSEAEGMGGDGRRTKKVGGRGRPLNGGRALWPRRLGESPLESRARRSLPGPCSAFRGADDVEDFFFRGGGWFRDPGFASR